MRAVELSSVLRGEKDEEKKFHKRGRRRGLRDRRGYVKKKNILHILSSSCKQPTYLAHPLASYSWDTLHPTHPPFCGTHYSHISPMGL